MRPTRHANRDEARLRFLFDNRVVSIDDAVDMTYWEIAEALDDLRERYGDPIAINLALRARQDEVGRKLLEGRIRPTMA